MCPRSLYYELSLALREQKQVYDSVLLPVQ